MAGKLVLVTGVGGFIAAHVAEQLLERGHRVRGTARGPKYALFAKAPARAGLEFARIDDVATGDFSAALAGVDAVIHLACALPGRKSTEETFASAIEGTMNVVRQAQKAGITKIVVTSSFGCLLSPTHMPAFHGLTFSEADWGTTSDEEFAQNKDDKFYVYFTAKIKAERALWDFARAHPALEVATVLPGYVLGPYSTLAPPPADVASMGTNDMVLALLAGGAAPIAPNWIADVRDVARAHVAALEHLPFPAPSAPSASSSSSSSSSSTTTTAAPPNANGADAGGPARFIINGGTLPWAKAAAHILSTRPGAAARMAPVAGAPPTPGVLSDLDTTRARTVLGLAALRAPEETMLAAVDAVVGLQKRWAEVN